MSGTGGIPVVHGREDVKGETITRQQIADLLTVCSHFDGRTLEPATFEAWYLLLGDLPYEDVETAIREHYRTDRRWIMPADIMARHKELAAARAVEQARLNPPPCGDPACAVPHRTSDRPGSPWAYPVRPHIKGCRAIPGMLVFEPGHVRWGIMSGLDPETFDELAYERERTAVLADPHWQRLAEVSRQAMAAIEADSD